MGTRDDQQPPLGLPPSPQAGSRQACRQQAQIQCCWTTSTGVFGFKPPAHIQTQLREVAWAWIVAPSTLKLLA